MVKNKEIQEQRMKGYFIQAAKEILKSEGIKFASVRNIAEKAGYSYATLYNYFKDVNDVIFLCVNDFQQECSQFIAEKIGNKPKGIERLKATAMAYCGYFVEYPGIFELFYLTPVGDFGNKQSIIDLIATSLDSVCSEDWDYCIAQNMLDSNAIAELKMQLRNCVVGSLTLYINRHIPMPYNDFIVQTSTIINNVVRF